MGRPRHRGALRPGWPVAGEKRGAGERNNSEQESALPPDLKTDQAINVTTLFARVIPVEATHGRGGSFAARLPSLARRSASKARISGAMALPRSSSSRG